nr:hypothetical protein OG461_33755 [Streptomyces sp. NBC_00995]
MPRDLLVRGVHPQSPGLPQPFATYRLSRYVVGCVKRPHSVSIRIVAASTPAVRRLRDRAWSSA